MASMSGQSEEIGDVSNVPQYCAKSRKCSRKRGHGGRCDTKGRQSSNRFWEHSRKQIVNDLKREYREKCDHKETEVAEKVARLNEKEAELVERERQSKEEVSITQNKKDELDQSIEDSRIEKEKLEQEMQEKKKALDEITKQYEKLKVLLDQKTYARTRRQNNPTTQQIISSRTNTTRFNRKKETTNILQFIHGGDEGSLYGAWDFLASNASKELMDKFISGYKRGKFLQGIFGKAADAFNKSEDALKQAVAMKFNNHLSRRKFNLVCKTQSSAFDPTQETWLPRCIKHNNIEIALPKIVSDGRVDRFIKSLDIGFVCQIPGASGVSRTVTGLVFMILDLHLRLPHLTRKLMWFNDNENHFIFQFSDDGAPETSELSMSIGSLTSWNFGDRVRSREYQYLLHCLSINEKDPVMEELWLQHSDEMLLLEGNILNVCGRECTVEFQPSADQSWQSWANNELNQAATYPSPYANVHKGNMCVMGGTIGTLPTDTWVPPSKEKRNRDLEKLDNFRKTLKSSLTKQQKHSRELEYMRENGLRQVGPPRIREFSDRQRPEPVHCEINAWQNILNIIYKEALNRNVVDHFLRVLSAPVATATTSEKEKTKVKHNLPHAEGTGERVWQHDLSKTKAEEFSARVTENIAPNVDVHQQLGCGLSFIASRIREHYTDSDKRGNNLSIRLIGEQAIALARYSYRLIDALEVPQETSAQKIQRLALGKACQYLRDACTLFNKVDTNITEINNLAEACKMYLNLLVLFFEPFVNVTVWTVGNAIPYHASLVYSKYKVGYGIISLQAKESKHSGIKRDLDLTNRSRSTGELGKWWQIMRANYVRAFYLPEHQPMPSTYTSHFQSRTPPCVDKPEYCECGRERDPDGFCLICEQCSEALLSAKNQQLTDAVLEVLKPMVCRTCQERFPDASTLQAHYKFTHEPQAQGVQARKTSTASNKINPQELTLKELKKELTARGLKAYGNKEFLIMRLETALKKER